jgi:hypothetical protein
MALSHLALTRVVLQAQQQRWVFCSPQKTLSTLGAALHGRHIIQPHHALTNGPLHLALISVT